MNQSVAKITSDRASTYLQQLCKHFAHKLPVEFTPEQGQITFSAGICRLEAKDNILTLRAEAEDHAGVQRVQNVIEKHLVRFAFRDPPKFEWLAAA